MADEKTPINREFRGALSSAPSAERVATEVYDMPYDHVGMGTRPAVTEPRDALSKIEQAKRIVAALCQGRIKWTLRVPAQVDDPDLVIMGALHAAEEALSAPSSGVLAIDDAVDAAMAFDKDSTYLSHPKVRPYRGTENGDSPEAWHRDYVTELCRVILAAGSSSAAPAGQRTGEPPMVAGEHPRSPGNTRDEIELYLRDAYAAGCSAVQSRSMFTAMEYAAREAPKLRALLAASASGGRALADVAAERRRQIEGEGWDAKHDDEHGAACMAVAGACYALTYAAKTSTEHLSWRDRYGATASGLWPWDMEWFKPKKDAPRRDLVRAAALLVAEIERLDRASSADSRSDK